MDTALFVFGWLFIVVSIGWIIVPYMMKRRDLVNGFALFMLGSANFVGYSAVQASSGEGYYMAPKPGDYIWFIAATIGFYSLFIFTYFKWHRPRRFLQRHLRVWPASDPTTLIFAALFSLSLALVGTVFIPRIPGLAQLLAGVAPQAAVLAFVLAVVAWQQQRANPILWVMLIAIAGMALVVSVFGSTGRRPLLSIMIAGLACFYWFRWRHRPPILNIVWVGAAGLGALVLLAGYSTYRHRDKEIARVSNPVMHAVESITKLPQAIISGKGDAIKYLGGNAITATFASIRYYDEVAPPEYFHSLIFVAINPIPRQFWESKPDSLGYTLPRDLGQWRHGFVNWGPGIIGHCAHDGGWVAVIVYAVIFGFFIRLLDDLLAMQPNNPFVLGILGAISGHLVALSRGDIGVFGIQIISGLIAVGVVAVITRKALRCPVDYMSPAIK